MAGITKQARLQKLRDRENAMRLKWKEAVKKAKQAKKTLTSQFARKLATLKKKLMSSEKAAYERALKDIQQILADKEKLKAKVLQKAEQQFEKQYAAKLKKKGKVKLGKKGKVATLITGKRRGRPPKHQAVARKDNNHHVEPNGEFD
jgi:Mn-containing catalase